MAEETVSAQPFEAVLDDEIREIERSRILRGLSRWGVVRSKNGGKKRPSVLDSSSLEVRTGYQEAARRNLLGLAFSGGGIRSATFNLGVLQALARFGLIRRFDYLSTVSGGGYIGGWLTSWIKRSGLAAVSEQLLPAESNQRHVEPREISYLRRFSNYLTPKTGFLSADTWTAVAIYIRNVLLNLVILVLALSSGLLVPRLLEWATVRVEKWPTGAGLPLAAIAVSIASGFVFRALGEIAAARKRGAELQPGGAYSDWAGQEWVQLGIVLPGFAISWLLTARGPYLPESDPLILGFVALALLSIVLLQTINTFAFPWEFLKVSAFIVLSGVAGAALLWFGLVPLVSEGFPWMVHPAFGFLDPVQARLVWGVPFAVAVFSVMVTLYVGLMGSVLDTDAREWWGRLSAWMMIYSMAWIAFFLIAFGARGFVDEFLNEWVRGLLASGWIGTTVGGLLAGRSSETGGEKSPWHLEMLARIAPYVFVVGLLVCLSYWIEAVVKVPFDDPMMVCLVIVGSLAIALFLSWRVGINDFSMYNFYRNRLTRCYLGASNRSRNPHPFTGFDPHEDEIRMGDLVVEQKGWTAPAHGTGPADISDSEIPRKESPYVGPYYVVNTALNLVAGDNLAWQKRMATSYAITPLYSGFHPTPIEKMRPPASDEEPRRKSPRSFLMDRLGVRLFFAKLDSAFKEGVAWYRKAFRFAEPVVVPPSDPRGGYIPTRLYQDGMPIGAAVTVSGAAASPNMGYHSSPPMAFLMTVFNVRLGRWIGNPISRKGDRSSPALGLPYLLVELFGLSNAKREYVYLSDGGHFENLGIYELVRRRCRFIVACDAEEDGKLQFDALGNAIEKCRTDFGVNIRINVDPIRKTREHPSEGRHCAVGTIDYGPGLPAGRLLYIKSSLTGDEPTDVKRYRDQNPAFPHQSTGDQFFDETQFESYRALGYHITNEVLAVAGEASNVDEMETEELFVRLDRQWHPPAIVTEGVFSHHAREYDNLIDEIRSTPHLRFLDTQINPGLRNLAKDARGAPGHRYWLPDTYYEMRAGYYMCARMIQLMESVYLDLDLDHECGHPDNQGWMNLFKNWAWAGMVRATWAITASVYGSRFRDFCERRLDLQIGEVCLGKPINLTGATTECQTVLDRCEDDLVFNFVEVLLLKSLIRPLEGVTKLMAYPVVVRVTVPLRPDDEKLDIAVGFGLVRNQELMYFRIQDHLREMGLARKALGCMIDQGVALRVGDWPEKQDAPGVTEYPKGPGGEELLSNARVHRFRDLFRSVRNEIGRPN